MARSAGNAGGGGPAAGCLGDQPAGGRPAGRGLRAWAVALLLAALAPARPWPPPPGARGAQEPLRAVASTTIVADLVRQVAGERWRVESLLPAGTDPHAFEPTSREARAVAGARLVVLVGGGLEGVSLVSLVRSAALSARVVELAPAVAEARPAAAGHPPDGRGAAGAPHPPGAEGRRAELDPHFWTSVPHAIQAVRLITRALQEADPEGAPGYAARAAGFIRELEALDAWVRDRVAAVPVGRRLLVTNHETLNYFAAQYGFQVVGSVLPSASRLAEPSAAEAARLVEALRRLRVPAVFTETTLPAVVARRLASEAGVRVVELYSDSLGPPGSGADSYVGYMRTNVTRIVEALGRAPETVPPRPRPPGGAAP